MLAAHLEDAAAQAATKFELDKLGTEVSCSNEFGCVNGAGKWQKHAMSMFTWNHVWCNRKRTCSTKEANRKRSLCAEHAEHC